MLLSGGGMLLGWSLGANDAGNVFGTAVGGRIISWRRAALLAAICAIAGAGLQGKAGTETLAGLTAGSGGATAAVFAAATTVIAMTLAKLPVSTSQAVVGGFIGAGLAAGDLHVKGLGKIAACWIGTPLGAMLAYVLLHLLLRGIISACRPTATTLDSLLRGGLVLCGCYGAYAMGANNAANTAVFIAAGTQLSPAVAAWLGGASIAGGILSFSRPLMTTIGRRIVELNSFNAFVVVLAEAVTVHLYAVLGVPVSTSQAVIGALVGVGLLKGLHIIYWKVLVRILYGWLGTPILAAALAFILATLP